MTEQQLDCALDLMRRLPPQQIEKNLSDLIDLVPELCEDLLSSVDQPLKIARDKTVGCNQTCQHHKSRHQSRFLKTGGVTRFLKISPFKVLVLVSPKSLGLFLYPWSHPPC